MENTYFGLKGHPPLPAQSTLTSVLYEKKVDPFARAQPPLLTKRIAVPGNEIA